MRKFAVSRLWWVVVIFLLLTTTYNSSSLSVRAEGLKPSLAIDSTPSADIKTKLEQLEKEIASKAARLKNEVNQKLKDKAYVGKVKTKSDQSLTIAAASGPKIVSSNQDTVFENKSSAKAKSSLKKLSAEDYIAALGDIDEAGVMTAKKIILLPAANPDAKTFLWGQIVTLSESLGTLKNRDLKNISFSLPSGSNVKLSDFVILTGSKNKNDIFEAEFVYATQKGFIKSKKTATPSAKLSTPSATKK